jgi:hypothetical protein
MDDYQNDINTLQQNMNSVIQKAIPQLELADTGLSGNVQTIIVGNTLYSVQISPIESEDSKKTAIKNSSSLADISECIKNIKSQLNLPPAVQLIQINTTKDPKLSLDNLNNEKTNRTPSMSISLYRSDTLELLNTSSCNKNNMFVALPLRNTVNLNMKLFNRLNEDGIDGFDKENKAFNDRCFSYRDIGGGDTTINSRRKYYFQGVSAQCYTNTAQCYYNGFFGNYLNCNCQTDPSNQVVSNFSPLTLPRVSPINIVILNCTSKSFNVSLC